MLDENIRLDFLLATLSSLPFTFPVLQKHITSCIMLASASTIIGIKKHIFHILDIFILTFKYTTIAKHNPKNIIKLFNIFIAEFITNLYLFSISISPIFLHILLFLSLRLPFLYLAYQIFVTLLFLFHNHMESLHT